MKLTRRNAMILGAGAFVAIGLPVRASATLAEDAIAAFTGGAEMGDAGITLTAPEIAENGNTAPSELATFQLALGPGDDGWGGCEIGG